MLQQKHNEYKNPNKKYIFTLLGLEISLGAIYIARNNF